MTDYLFQLWFSATWQAIVLALVVFLVMFLFRERLQPRWRYLLWCVVLLRLALPILPETPWGIWNEKSSSAAPKAVVDTPAPLQNTLQNIPYPESNPVILHPMENVVAMPVETAMPMEPIVESSRPTFGQRLKHGFLFVWFVGVVFLFGKSIWNEYRFRRQSRFWADAVDPKLLAFFEECRKAVDVGCRVRLKTTADNVGAGCFGIFRPMIVLSESVMKMNSQDLRMILIHELVHVKRFDPLVLRISTLLSLIHWMNPLVWFVLVRLQRERELACDAAVLHLLGQQKQKDYGLAILAFAELFPCREPLPGLVGIFEKNGTARRIDMIIKYKRSKWTHAFLGMLLITLVAAIGLTRAQTDADSPRNEGAETSRQATVDDAEADEDYNYFQSEENAKPEDIRRYEETKYIVPDGSPEEMLAYIRKTFNNGYIGIDQTKEGREFFYRQCRVIKEAAEKGLAGNPEGETRKDLLNFKMLGFTGPLPRRSELFPEFKEFVEELEKNPDDKEVATNARGRYFEAWNSYYFLVNRPTSEEFIAHRNAVLDFAKNEKNYQQLLGNGLMSAAGKLKDRTLALDTAKMVREMLENSPDEFNRTFAYRSEGILNKQWLKKDGLRIVGVTLDDEKFDLVMLRGKPIIVIFWKPQSDALESILPKLKTAYEKYHECGLEIVGICCDDQKEPNAKVVTEEELKALPWSVNLSETKTIAADLPSNREYYDLHRDHFFLVDTEGMVKLDYHSTGTMMGGPPRKSDYREIGDLIDGKFVSAEDLLERELEKMFPEQSVKLSVKALIVKTVDETGKPLGKVNIRVHLPDFKDDNRPKTTDEHGNMVLCLPESPKELFISANAPGRVPQLAHWEREDMNSGVKIPDTVTFTLRKGNTIGGIVVDQDGMPVEGAVLQVLSRPNGYGMPGHLKPADSHILAFGDGKPNVFGGVTSCKTDQNGRWTLDNVPDGKFYPVEIEIFHPDFIMNDELGRTSFSSQNDALIEKLRKGEYRFTMKRGVSVSGTVRNFEGKPVKDALIVPGGDSFYYHDDRQKAVRTDADGKYRIDALRFGSGTITVIAEGFAPDMKEAKFEKDMKPIDFDLKPGKMISFRFIDEKGELIPKVQANIGSNPDSWWREGSNIFNKARSGANQEPKIPVYADDDGIYRWDWAPDDKLKFTFHKEGFLMEVFSRDNWFVARSEPYEIVLHHQKIFRGTVVDAETNQPIKEYKIVYGSLTNNLRDIDNYTWQIPQEQTFTGTEAFQYVPLFKYDKYFLRFMAEGYDAFISGPYPLGEEPPMLKIALKRAIPSQKTLSGQVLLPDGKPAENAGILLAVEREFVQITPPNLSAMARGRPRSVVKTDGQGRFRLELTTEGKDYRL